MTGAYHLWLGARRDRAERAAAGPTVNLIRVMPAQGALRRKEAAAGRRVKWRPT